MKYLTSVIIAYIFLAILAIGISLAILAIGISVYGAVLAFKASIILGIITLVIEPAPFVFGIVAIFGTNIPDIIQNWINFPI